MISVMLDVEKNETLAQIENIVLDLGGLSCETLLFIRTRGSVSQGSPEITSNHSRPLRVQAFPRKTVTIAYHFQFILNYFLSFTTPTVSVKGNHLRTVLEIRGCKTTFGQTYRSKYDVLISVQDASGVSDGFLHNERPPVMCRRLISFPCFNIQSI